jgi:hypothetical protein
MSLNAKICLTNLATWEVILSSVVLPTVLFIRRLVHAVVPIEKENHFSLRTQWMRLELELLSVDGA